MIAAGADGRIYADDDGKKLFARLNTQLPNITIGELGKYESGVIYTEPGKLAPEPAQISTSAKDKMERMQADFKATDIPMINDAAQAVAAVRDGSKLLLIGGGILLLLLILRR